MDEICSQTIQQLVDSILDQQISAESVCNHYLEKIDNDSHEAITCKLRDSAAASAYQVDKAISRGSSVGDLAGIPVVVKDNINTVSATCSAGLPHLLEFQPNQDADVVYRLKQAGATVVGMSATDSGAFGVTTPHVKNPKFPELIAGGSSGGSAAAVAGGLCKFALGTDTGGSIRIPAACCGIWGFKPTYAASDLGGIRPLAFSYDHVGPLATSAKDLLYVMKALSLHAKTEIARIDDPVIGMPESYISDASPEIQEGMLEFKVFCQSLGLQIKPVKIPCPEEILPGHLILSLTEAALYHLDNFSEDIKDYPSVAKASIEIGKSFSSCDYLKAKKEMHQAVSIIKGCFDSIDFIAVPTLPIPVPKKEVDSVSLNGQKISILEALIRYTAPFNQAGIPVISSPWRVQGGNMTISIQLAGPAGSDFRLLNFAHSLEKSSTDLSTNN